MMPSICHELRQLHSRTFGAHGAMAYILDPAAPAACHVNKEILGVMPLCICHKAFKPAVDGTCNACRFLSKIGFRFCRYRLGKNKGECGAIPGRYVPIHLHVIIKLVVFGMIYSLLLCFALIVQGGFFPHLNYGWSDRVGSALSGRISRIGGNS